MRRAARILLLVLWLCLPGRTADSGEGAPDPSVAAVLPGCRAIAEGKGFFSSPEAAFCSGMIEALTYFGEMLPEDFRYCVPLSVPLDEVVKAVVYELEDLGSAVHRQQFRGLAIAVLQFRWPCRYEP